MLPSIGLLALLAAMVLTLYDMRSALKPSTCAECGHCRAIAEAAAVEQESLDRDYARQIGLTDDEDDDRTIGKRSRP